MQFYTFNLVQNYDQITYPFVDTTIPHLILNANQGNIFPAFLFCRQTLILKSSI